MLNTPILLITFNRPEHTRKVLSAIREAKPKELFIAQDGPRDGNQDDIERCLQVRQVISELVDWDCDLHTRFSDVNLGCGPGPASAISWFFENVEQGMIFEDDCLPSSSIFSFYEQLLNQYKNDEQISLITGTNVLSKWCSNKYDYLFCKSGGMTMGCWASWRRSWKWFDWEVKSWGNQVNKDRLHQVVGEKHFADWKKLLDKIYVNPPHDAWDYQWAYARRLHNSISIVSTVNQMSNIGFGKESTHTPNENDRRCYQKLFECHIPLRNRKIVIDKIFDWVMYQRFERKTKKSIVLRLLLKIIDFRYRR